jgi:hypothetical protein
MMTQTKTSTETKSSQALNAWVGRLQHVETTNVCVQVSIGVLAALADPVRWESLIADGSEAVGQGGDEDLESFFQEVLEGLDGHP